MHSGRSQAKVLPSDCSFLTIRIRLGLRDAAVSLGPFDDAHAATRFDPDAVLPSSPNQADNSRVPTLSFTDIDTELVNSRAKASDKFNECKHGEADCRSCAAIRAEAAARFAATRA